MSPMKIVHITTVHRPDDVRIYWKMSKSLADAGHDVAIVGSQCDNAQVKGVRYVPIKRYRQRLLRFCTSLQAYMKARKERADIYHVHDPELLPAAFLLSITGHTVVYDSHENFEDSMLHRHYLPVWSRKLLSRLLGSIELFVCRWLSGMVFATESISKRFSALSTPSAVINNYPIVAPVIVTCRERGSKPIRDFIYIGGLAEERGARVMMRAFDLLPAEQQGILHLVGLITQRGLRDEMIDMSGWRRVKEYGVIGRDKVKDVLLTADVGIVLFQDLPNHTESQPNKLFEYMEAGLPVIASGFPLWRRLIEDEAHCGICVDESNPQAVVDAMQWMQRNPGEARAMGERGRDAVEAKFSWDSEFTKLIQFYREIKCHNVN